MSSKTKSASNQKNYTENKVVIQSEQRISGFYSLLEDFRTQIDRYREISDLLQMTNSEIESIGEVKCSGEQKEEVRYGNGILQSFDHVLQNLTHLNSIMGDGISRLRRFL